MKLPAHKIGAVSYALWGAIHLGAGLVWLYILWAKGSHAALALVGSNLPPEQVPTVPPGVGMGVLYQHGWNLAWFGGFSLYVALKLNWNNSRAGYWVNLAVVSLADIGYIGAMVIPRYPNWLDSLAGPLTWTGGALFTTVGYLRREPDAGG